MKANRRQENRLKRTLDLIRRNGEASYADIASELAISESTARKYCMMLSKRRLIGVAVKQVPEVFGTGWGQRHYWRLLRR